MSLNLKEIINTELSSDIINEIDINSVIRKHDAPEELVELMLEWGISVEMEHTDDPNIAREIAMDHLMEDPVYYKKLKEMEG
ncbi:MAG: hypothetical protein KAH32_08765 [Chlamydiia bacterium]|nr:hypothetical protein [Chlamydiia bacterium]